MKERILQVINVFETGSKQGNYSAISIFEDGPNDRKQITYGRSQTTEFGGLPDLIKSYTGQYAKEFECYMDRLGKLPSLCENKDFLDLLRKAGEDPVMRKTQDDFFDKRYWNPSVEWCNKHGFKLPLSTLVVYDSYIHSGGILSFLKDNVDGATPSEGGNEKDWIISYVDIRERWLKNHRRTILRNTIYRTQLFKSLIKDDNWDLKKGFKTQGITFPAEDDGLCLPNYNELRKFYGEALDTSHLGWFSFPTEVVADVKIDNKIGDIRPDYVIHKLLVSRIENGLRELYDTIGPERYKKEGWNVFGGTYRNADKLAVTIIFNPISPRLLSDEGIGILEKYGFLNYGRSIKNPSKERSLFVAYIPEVKKGSYYDQFGLPNCLKF